jgi:hypothetical protein
MGQPEPEPEPVKQLQTKAWHLLTKKQQPNTITSFKAILSNYCMRHYFLCNLIATNMQTHNMHGHLDTNVHKKKTNVLHNKL